MQIDTLEQARAYIASLESELRTNKDTNTITWNLALERTAMLLETSEAATKRTEPFIDQIYHDVVRTCTKAIRSQKIPT